MPTSVEGFDLGCGGELPGVDGFVSVAFVEYKVEDIGFAAKDAIDHLERGGFAGTRKGVDLKVALSASGIEDSNLLIGGG
jgi:hypothetical protein